MIDRIGAMRVLIAADNANTKRRMATTGEKEAETKVEAANDLRELFKAVDEHRKRQQPLVIESTNGKTNGKMNGKAGTNGDGH